jgi:hypothetical protein
VAEQAIQQIPAERIEDVELLLRGDSAGASHEPLDRCREGRVPTSRSVRSPALAWQAGSRVIVWRGRYPASCTDSGETSNPRCRSEALICTCAACRALARLARSEVDEGQAPDP